MDIAQLATTTAGLIAPFLPKLLEGAELAMKDGAHAAVKALWVKLADAFKEDPGLKAAGDLARAGASPEITERGLAEQVKRYLQEHPEVLRDVEADCEAATQVQAALEGGQIRSSSQAAASSATQHQIAVGPGSAIIGSTQTAGEQGDAASDTPPTTQSMVAQQITGASQTTIHLPLAQMVEKLGVILLGIALLSLAVWWTAIRQDPELRRCLEGDNSACVVVARAGWADRHGGGAETAARALEAACSRGSGCACGGLGMMNFNEGLLGDGSQKKMAGYIARADGLCPGWEARCPREGWWSAIGYDDVRAQARPGCLTESPGCGLGAASRRSVTASACKSP